MRKFAVPYLDVMTLLVLVLLLLIFAALMKISDAESKAQIETTSKYLITLTWSDGSRNDVDLWVKTPLQNTIGFRPPRQADFVSLDNDDLGSDVNRIIDDAGNEVVVNHREEIMFVKATLPGTYVVNIMLYSQKQDGPETCIITLTEVGAKVRQIARRQIVLTERHEERTAFRVLFNQDGKLIETDSLEELFVNQALSGNAP